MNGKKMRKTILDLNNINATGEKVIFITKYDSMTAKKENMRND